MASRSSEVNFTKNDTLLYFYLYCENLTITAVAVSRDSIDNKQNITNEDSNKHSQRKTVPRPGQLSSGEEQEAQLSQWDRAMLRVIKYCTNSMSFEMTPLSIGRV